MSTPPQLLHAAPAARLLQGSPAASVASLSSLSTLSWFPPPCTEGSRQEPTNEAGVRSPQTHALEQRTLLVGWGRFSSLFVMHDPGAAPFPLNLRRWSCRSARMSGIHPRRTGRRTLSSFVISQSLQNERCFTLFLASPPHCHQGVSPGSAAVSSSSETQPAALLNLHFTPLALAPVVLFVSLQMHMRGLPVWLSW